ncbi:MAG: GNAT family N-acetyltransferase [Chitinophagales bacterium]
MLLTQYSNPQEFLQKVCPFLERNEAMNNLLLGTSFRLAQPDNSEIAAKALLIVVEEKKEVVFVAIQTAPHSLIIAAKAEYMDKGSEAIIKLLEDEEMEIPGVIGEKSLGHIFAQKWCSRKNLGFKSLMEMGVFQLDKVTELDIAEGNLRLVNESDEDLLTDWILGFDSETFQEETLESARKLAKVKLQSGRQYIWETNGVPVSMASGTRPTNHCMTISVVYTPPKYRKNGYARSCVAQISRMMLDRGYQFCALFTDLSNPTSNKIYQEVGYYKVGEFVNLKFI